jgi:hypothetical protein
MNVTEYGGIYWTNIPNHHQQDLFSTQSAYQMPIKKRNMCPCSQVPIRNLAMCIYLDDHLSWKKELRIENLTIYEIQIRFPKKLTTTKKVDDLLSHHHVPIQSNPFSTAPTHSQRYVCCTSATSSFGGPGSKLCQGKR